MNRDYIGYNGFSNQRPSIYVIDTNVCRSSSSTSSSTSDEKLLPDGDIDFIYDLYEDYIGRLSRMAMQTLEAMLAATTPEVLVYAIKQTSMAPMPSLRYLQAIVQRCIAQGCKTAEECERRPARAQRQRRVLADQAYSQREYKEGIEAEAWAELMERR